MIHLLSPAKSLDFQSQPPINDFTTPKYISEAQKLTKKLNSLSSKKIKDLMSISDALTELNVNRYKKWEGKEELSPTSKQAIFSFTGDVYQGLNAQTLDKKALDFAQNHLIILSGMYGVLKPLDLIEPYRLEMGTKLKIGRSNNLYEFWKDQPTELINESLRKRQGSTVINLASNEYFKVVNAKKVKGKIISPEFKDEKNGTYKIISFFAKKARGLMSRYIIENQITHSDDLEGFDFEGYRFNSDMSSIEKPVYTREENWSH